MGLQTTVGGALSITGGMERSGRPDPSSERGACHTQEAAGEVLWQRNSPPNGREGR